MTFKETNKVFKETSLELKVPPCAQNESLVNSLRLPAATENLSDQQKLAYLKYQDAKRQEDLGTLGRLTQSISSAFHNIWCRTCEISSLCGASIVTAIKHPKATLKYMLAAVRGKDVEGDADVCALRKDQIEYISAISSIYETSSKNGSVLRELLAVNSSESFSLPSNLWFGVKLGANLALSCPIDLLTVPIYSPLSWMGEEIAARKYRDSKGKKVNYASYLLEGRESEQVQNILLGFSILEFSIASIVTVLTAGRAGSAAVTNTGKAAEFLSKISAFKPYTNWLLTNQHRVGRLLNSYTMSGLNAGGNYLMQESDKRDLRQTATAFFTSTAHSAAFGIWLRTLGSGLKALGANQQTIGKFTSRTDKFDAGTDAIELTDDSKKEYQKFKNSGIELNLDTFIDVLLPKIAGITMRGYSTYLDSFNDSPKTNLSSKNTQFKKLLKEKQQAEVGETSEVQKLQAELKSVAETGINSLEDLQRGYVTCRIRFLEKNYPNLSREEIEATAKKEADKVLAYYDPFEDRLIVSSENVLSKFNVSPAMLRRIFAVHEQTHRMLHNKNIETAKEEYQAWSNALSYANAHDIDLSFKYGVLSFQLLNDSFEASPEIREKDRIQRVLGKIRENSERKPFKISPEKKQEIEDYIEQNYDLNLKSIAIKSTQDFAALNSMRVALLNYSEKAEALVSVEDTANSRVEIKSVLLKFAEIISDTADNFVDNEIYRQDKAVLLRLTENLLLSRNKEQISAIYQTCTSSEKAKLEKLAEAILDDVSTRIFVNGRDLATLNVCLEKIDFISEAYIKSLHAHYVQGLFESYKLALARGEFDKLEVFIAGTKTLFKRLPYQFQPFHWLDNIEEIVNIVFSIEDTPKQIIALGAFKNILDSLSITQLEKDVIITKIIFALVNRDPQKAKLLLNQDQVPRRRILELLAREMMDSIDAQGTELFHNMEGILEINPSELNDLALITCRQVAVKYFDYDLACDNLSRVLSIIGVKEDTFLEEFDEICDTAYSNEVKKEWENLQLVDSGDLKKINEIKIRLSLLFNFALAEIKITGQATRYRQFKAKTANSTLMFPDDYAELPINHKKVLHDVFGNSLVNNLSDLLDNNFFPYGNLANPKYTVSFEVACAILKDLYQIGAGEEIVMTLVAKHITFICEVYKDIFKSPADEFHPQTHDQIFQFLNTLKPWPKIIEEVLKHEGSIAILEDAFCDLILSPNVTPRRVNMFLEATFLLTVQEEDSHVEEDTTGRIDNEITSNQIIFTAINRVILNEELTSSEKQKRFGILLAAANVKAICFFMDAHNELRQDLQFSRDFFLEAARYFSENCPEISLVNLLIISRSFARFDIADPELISYLEAQLDQNWDYLTAESFSIMLYSMQIFAVLTGDNQILNEILEKFEGEGPTFTKHLIDSERRHNRSLLTAYKIAYRKLPPDLNNLQNQFKEQRIIKSKHLGKLENDIHQQLLASGINILSFDYIEYQEPDFVLKIGDRKIIIQADGKQFHYINSDIDQGRFGYDVLVDQLYIEAGYEVIRITNEEYNEHQEDFIQYLAERLEYDNKGDFIAAYKATNPETNAESNNLRENEDEFAYLARVKRSSVFLEHFDDFFNRVKVINNILTVSLADFTKSTKIIFSERAEEIEKEVNKAKNETEENRPTGVTCLTSLHRKSALVNGALLCYEETKNDYQRLVVPLILTPETTDKGTWSNLFNSLLLKYSREFIEQGRLVPLAIRHCQDNVPSIIDFLLISLKIIYPDIEFQVREIEDIDAEGNKIVVTEIIPIIPLDSEQLDPQSPIPESIQNRLSPPQVEDYALVGVGNESESDSAFADDKGSKDPLSFISPNNIVDIAPTGVDADKDQLASLQVKHFALKEAEGNFNNMPPLTRLDAIVSEIERLLKSSSNPNAADNCLGKLDFLLRSEPSLFNTGEAQQQLYVLFVTALYSAKIEIVVRILHFINFDQVTANTDHAWLAEGFQAGWELFKERKANLPTELAEGFEYLFVRVVLQIERVVDNLFDLSTDGLETKHAKLIEQARTGLLEPAIRGEYIFLLTQIQYCVLAGDFAEINKLLASVDNPVLIKALKYSEAMYQLLQTYATTATRMLNEEETQNLVDKYKIREELAKLYIEYHKLAKMFSILNPSEDFFGIDRELINQGQLFTVDLPKLLEKIITLKGTKEDLVLREILILDLLMAIKARFPITVETANSEIVELKSFADIIELSRNKRLMFLYFEALLSDNQDYLNCFEIIFAVAPEIRESYLQHSFDLGITDKHGNISSSARGKSYVQCILDNLFLAAKQHVAFYDEQSGTSITMLECVGTENNFLDFTTEQAEILTNLFSMLEQHDDFKTINDLIKMLQKFYPDQYQSEEMLAVYARFFTVATSIDNSLMLLRELSEKPGGKRRFFDRVLSDEKMFNQIKTCFTSRNDRIVLKPRAEWGGLEYLILHYFERFLRDSPELGIEDVFPEFGKKLKKELAKRNNELAKVTSPKMQVMLAQSPLLQDLLIFRDQLRVVNDSTYQNNKRIIAEAVKVDASMIEDLDMSEDVILDLAKTDLFMALRIVDDLYFDSKLYQCDEAAVRRRRNQVLMLKALLDKKIVSASEPYLFEEHTIGGSVAESAEDLVEDINRELSPAIFSSYLKSMEQGEAAFLLPYIYLKYPHLFCYLPDESRTKQEVNMGVMYQAIYESQIDEKVYLRLLQHLETVNSLIRLSEDPRNPKEKAEYIIANLKATFALLSLGIVDVSGRLESYLFDLLLKFSGMNFESKVVQEAYSLLIFSLNGHPSINPDLERKMGIIALNLLADQNKNQVFTEFFFRQVADSGLLAELLIRYPDFRLLVIETKERLRANDPRLNPSIRKIVEMYFSDIKIPGLN